MRSSSRRWIAPEHRPEWDAKAWERLQAVIGQCPCGGPEATPRVDCPVEPWMLMYHESGSRAIFKHRITRATLVASLMLALSFTILLLFALPEPVQGAEEPSDQAVVAFVLRHSPRLREAKALLPTFGNLLKIEAWGRVMMPEVGLEGQGVGLVASFPLLDRREKAERTLKVLEVEQEVRADAASLLTELRSLQAQIRLGELLLKEMEGQLQWLKRRVQAGVEYQKEANRFLLELFARKAELDGAHPPVL